MNLFTRVSTRPKIRPVSPDTVERIKVNPDAAVLGGTRDIHLDSAEDLQAVLAVLHVMKDETDTAREIVREMSARDRALLSFHLRETLRLAEEEDTFREQADRRRGREGHPAWGDDV